MLGDGEQIALTISEVIREWKAEVGPEAATVVAAIGGRRRGILPKFYDVDYLPDGRIQRVAPNRPGVPFRVESTPDGPGQLAISEV